MNGRETGVQRPSRRGPLPLAAIDLPAMSDFDNEHHQARLFDGVEDAVISDAYAPEVAFATELLRSWRPRI
jgi:hypothetical protein